MYLEKEGRKVLGFAWVTDTLKRPIYEDREIKRGKNKGKHMICYRYSATEFKRVAVPASSVLLFKEVLT